MGKSSEVAITNFHHGVQGLNHHTEIVLEATCVSSHCEVTGCSTRGKALNLLIDGSKVSFGCYHRLSECRLLSRKLFHVGAKVAHGISLHHLHQTLGYVIAGCNELVALSDHCSKDTRKL